MLGRLGGFLTRIGGHFFASLFVLLLSCWVAREAYTMGLGSLHSPGPGFMVFIASVLLGLLALQILATSIVRCKEPPKPVPAKKRRGLVCWVFLVLAAYVLLLNQAGYLVVTFLLLLALFALLHQGKKRWGTMILSAVLGSGVTYVVFSHWFKLQLPQGWIHW